VILTFQLHLFKHQSQFPECHSVSVSLDEKVSHLKQQVEADTEEHYLHHFVVNPEIQNQFLTKDDRDSRQN